MLHTDTMSPQKVRQKGGYLENLPYFCSVLIKHMCKVMKYSLYKADAEEENEDSPKLDEKPGGGSTNEYTAT